MGRMKRRFRVGDHVSWNSEAGRVRGTITKVIATPTRFKGYTIRATRDEPQYQIISDKTDHVAVHKASALSRLRSKAPRKGH